MATRRGRRHVETWSGNGRVHYHGAVTAEVVYKIQIWEDTITTRSFDGTDTVAGPKSGHGHLRVHTGILPAFTNQLTLELENGQYVPIIVDDFGPSYSVELAGGPRDTL